MIQCVIWAVKHELFTIYDLGLDVLYVILEVRIRYLVMFGLECE